MNMTLYVNNKKLRFYWQAGWFSGNQFSLINFQILTGIEEGYAVLISLQIARLTLLDIGVEVIQ